MEWPRRRKVWFRWLVAHAAVVVVCTVAFEVIVAATPPEAGFNFGVIFAAAPLEVLGLPWNAPTLSNPYQFDGLPPLLWSLVYFGPAFLNVALHGALFWSVGRRQRRSPGSAAGRAQG